jgi:hypothetical protein
MTDEAETDVLAFMSFRPPIAQVALHRSLERVNGKIKRKTDVVGILTGLVGAILLKQNDDEFDDVVSGFGLIRPL